MASVTQRVRSVKQPYGGYINPRSALTVVKTGYQTPLHDIKEENATPALVGTAVDYLTRFMVGTPVEKAFAISLIGAEIIGNDTSRYTRNIHGLDDASIVSAIRLAGYDSLYRAGLHAYSPVASIEPNTATIENVRSMVESGIEFFKDYGPTTHEGMTFEGGYTNTVNTGDADFMTADALWDFKCSVKPPTNKHTLQITMYWLMGLHSIEREQYKDVERLGFFNPRLAEVFMFNVKDIPVRTLRAIEVDVIGYRDTEALF